MEREHAQGHAAQPPAADEAPAAQQRDSLHGLLRSLDFLQAEAALKPSGDGGSAKRPKVDPGVLAQLVTLVPTALTELTGRAPESATPAAKAAEPDPKEKEAEEAAEAVAALEPVEGEGDPLEAEEDEGHDVDEESAAPVAEAKPVQHKRARRARRARRVRRARRARKVVKARARRSGGNPRARLLPLPRAKKALRWTVRKPFGRSRFLMRRFQRALGDPANGRPSIRFVRSVAVFQKERGIRATGVLAGRTARLMRWRLVHRFGLRGGLTRVELKMARTRNVRAVRGRRLRWKTIQELRHLLGLPKKGGLDASFIRRVARFQAKHHLGQSGYVSARTVKTIRAVKGGGDFWNDAIYREALAQEGWSTRSGPDGGNLACAWAVNRVLKAAIGRTIGNDAVSAVEADLQGGLGMRVKIGQEKPGDIVLIPGRHIGIVIGKGRALSNSSSRAAWVWRSDLSFNPSYGGTPHIYRVRRKR